MMNFRRCLPAVLLEGGRGAATKLGMVRYTHSRRRSSAGIIVIGNEILKAQVNDTNSVYACSLLYARGVRVDKISVVRDDVQDIAKEITDFSQKYEYVFTSGGIGPTHDDVTYEALAVAFDDTLHRHPKLVDVVKNLFGYKSPSSPAYKLAFIPTRASLKFGTDEATGRKLSYPCVVLENVYVFPGSPVYFETSFGSLCKEMFSSNQSFSTAELYANAREESFADALTVVAKEYPNVSLGSYPESNRYYKVRVTIESETAEETAKARRRFCDLVPTNILVPFDRAPQLDCFAKYEEFLRRTGHRRDIYARSFEQLEKLYRKPNEASVYLDGSIESIILVHLARAATSKLGSSGTKIHAIRFDSDESLPSVHRFLRDIVDRYNVELCVLRHEGDARQAIEKLALPKVGLRTILLGKRSATARNEFYDDLTCLSKGRRIQRLEIASPLIDWTNEDTEMFAASLSLPYHDANG